MKKIEKQTQEETELTQNEIDFCELYVFGGCEYAGKMQKCYIEAFGSDKKNIPLAARRILAKPHIASKIKELSATMQNEIEAMAVKLQVTETLKSVMEETATAQYQDKNGYDLSPAPLRAVSVNAAKALMDLYPIKHVHESKLRVEGADGNVIFNVIVPEMSRHED